MIDIKVRIAMSKTFEPFVILETSKSRSVLTPKEAIEHALTILESADITILNAFLAEYLTTNLNLQQDHIKGMLNDFREFRERKKREETISTDIMDPGITSGTS